MLDACRYLDVAAVLGAVVGVFVLTNSNHPGAASIAGFLNMRVTVKNLLVVKIDAEQNLIYLRGAVPGPRNAYVAIKRAKRG